MRSTLKLAILLLVATALAPFAAAQMTTTVGGFTMTFAGVEYDWEAHTSKWSYDLTWNAGWISPETGNNPELSHLTIDLCDTPGVQLLAWEPATFPVGTSEGASDPGDWGFVIKWDQIPGGALTQGVPFRFSFTLGDTYAVGPVTFFAKAGRDNNQGEIYGPICTIADPSIDVAKSCVPEAWVGSTITYVVTVTNTGNVALTNVNVTDSMLVSPMVVEDLEPGASKTLTYSVPAAQVGSIENHVTAAGSYWGNVVTDDASCSTLVLAPEVSKTAVTSYERAWDWTLAKEVTEASLDFCGAGSVDLHYTISASRDNVDSDHEVTGTIIIFNPSSTLTASIDSVVDNFAGYAGAVSCPTYAVGPGASVACSYEITLPGAVDGTNLATVKLVENATIFTGSAAVVFGAPTVEIDATAVVVDAVTCPAGFTCSEAGPFTFADDGSAEFTVTLTKTSAECNSYFSVVNIATLRTESGETHAAAASTEIYTCECPNGCTLTIGYWKTHAGFTGRNDDDVTQFLPIWLGTPYGANSIEVGSAAQAVSILKFELGAASNGITKLYAQLLGAKLNIGNGASYDDVSNVIAKADAFLALYSYADWTSLTKKQKSDVITWMSLLDAYNNGDIGPGHCD